MLYFKDGKVRTTYTSADGLGKGHVAGLRLDRDGALWAATQEGGLSRIKDGRIRTLTIRNGLPCNTIHWSIEDDDRSLWIYTACGLVRVTRDELDAWIADPTHMVETRRWGAADGVPLRAISPAYSNPPVAKAADGKLWFVSGEGVQVIDPDHLPFNTIPPPVYIEHVIADRKPYSVANGLRLPPLVRDVTIEFTALSLVDPQGVHFRYRLEGHDNEWQEAGDRRQAFYTNLRPETIASSSRHLTTAACGMRKERSSSSPSRRRSTRQSGFASPARSCSSACVWSGCSTPYAGGCRREEKRLREVIEGIPAMAFSVHPDGSPDLVNQRWLDYTGLSQSKAEDGRGWESTIHPDDLEAHLDKWRAALASGEPFENEARHRSASGRIPLVPRAGVAAA